MATLEKIRSKSVLLFTVIIVALLAFILGDFLTSQRSYFGPGDTVASVDGAKVKYPAYQERINAVSEQQRNQGQQQDNDVLAQQTIDQLLVEALLEREYDRMGITVTDQQLSDLMLGDAAPMVFNQLMSTFGQAAQVLYSKGIVDTRTYYDAMQNPAKYGLTAEDAQAMRLQWSTFEKSVDGQLKSNAYGLLISGLFTANEVDAKEMYNGTNNTTHFTYVRKDFTSVPNDQVKPTEKDYKAEYDKHKGMFRIREEQRAVSFIMVPVIPSDADFRKGQSEVETVIAELTTTEGTEVLNNHPDFVNETGKYTRNSLSRDADLRSLTTDSVAIAAGNVRVTKALGGNYVIAKVLDVEQGVDRVKFTAFGEMEAQMDSIRGKLTVANFDSIARSYQEQIEFETSLVNPTVQLSEAQAEALKNRAVGEIFFLNDTINGTDAEGNAVQQVATTAFLINERDAQVPVYKIAKVSYTVVPSSETVKDLNTKFHAFVANNASAKAFSENADKSGYTLQQAMVSNSTPLVGSAPQSRGAVKWAMNNKKGKVSPVFTKSGAEDYLLAVAVDDVYSGDYLPVDAKIVRDMLQPMVMANLKAEKVKAELAAKNPTTMEAYASATGSPVAQADAVFNDSQIAGIGFAEAAVSGAVAGAEKGKVTGPIQGNNAVYVITVTGTDTKGRPYDFKESSTVFAQKYVNALMNNPALLFAGDKNIKNNILEFTADEVN